MLGSEGRLGILTEATVRISPLPECELFHAVFFPDWKRAECAALTIVQARLGLSLLRLSNAPETATLLALAGQAPWLGQEKGALGIELLRGAFQLADPDGRMNPGKLLAQ